MLERLLNFSLTQRLIVILATVGLVIWGAISWTRLNLDAVPDITPNQVQIITKPGGLSPQEIEKLVSFPIETGVGGIPGVVSVRSLSQYGLSVVTVVFRENVDIYFARQMVGERLNMVRDQLPPSIDPPQMGPISTGLGEIYMFTLSSDIKSAMELRTIHDWVVAPQLKTVPGVADVSVGDGSKRQYKVVLDPQRMKAHNVSVGEVIEALQVNNENAGGGVMDVNGERILIRSVGAASSTEEVGQFVVASEKGVPILIRDVADVQLGTPIVTGIGTKDGRQAMVSMVLMLQGANGQTVSDAVDARVQEIRKLLPPDVKMSTDYNRAILVGKAVGTVEKSLLEGGALVLIVLLALLGNVRGALIVALAIPLSMLFAIGMMNYWGISGNLMSLGAIDFGLIIDGAVVMIENTVRRLAERREHEGRMLTRDEVRQTVWDASKEVAKPTAFAVSIITVVYLPILSLEGTEGKMFKPMAFTVVFALIGALLLTLTLVPALASIFLSRNTHEKSNPIMGLLDRIYRPALKWALKARLAVVLGAAVLLAIAGSLFGTLGSEFVPTLDEGDLIVQPTRMRTVDDKETLRLVTAAEKKMLEVPEVLTVFSRSGTPEAGTDPMPLSLTDSFVRLKEPRNWRPGMTKQKIQEEIEKKLEDVPGQGYGFTQPIQMRFSELQSGVRADVGIKIFGEDLEMLQEKANEIATVARSVKGSVDVEVEQVDQVPMLEIVVDRAAMARYGVNVAEIQRIVRNALGGAPMGQIIEGDKRFDLTLALPPEIRNSATQIADLPVRTANGETVGLASVAKIDIKQAPAQVSRDQGRRRVIIQLNIRGRDLGSTVRDLQAKIAKQVKLPEGYYLEYGGQFENLQKASARLMLVVPVALGLIFTLLFMTFGSVKQALLIFSGVPLAVTGGIIALFVRGMPFSISAGIGFIALSGVAVLNGVVMVSAINRLRDDGALVPEAVQIGATQRLRPVLMTALVAALGFIPMALNTGIGAEVQRPLATVVIGGIISATMLTLVVLPVLYTWFEKDQSISGPEEANQE